MLTVVPLPDQPLTLLWQSTVIDIEPGTRYGYKHDAAAINTTLAIVNQTAAPIHFPLVLVTTDPMKRDSSHRTVRVGSEESRLRERNVDREWEELVAACVASQVGQGQPAERIEAYFAALRPLVQRAYRSKVITIEPGQQRFVRSHNRHLMRLGEDGNFRFQGIFPLPQFMLATGGSISVSATLPRSVQGFNVDLVDWTRGFNAQAFGKDAGLPLVGGRFVVSWLWQNDPELSVTYRYP